MAEQLALPAVGGARCEGPELTLVYSVSASISAYVVWESSVAVLSVTRDTALLIRASLLRDPEFCCCNTRQLCDLV